MAFEIENDIPYTGKTKSGEASLLVKLKETIGKMKVGQSIFIEDNIHKISSVTAAITDVRKTFTDVKIVLKVQKEEEGKKGVRIWVLEHKQDGTK